MAEKVTCIQTVDMSAVTPKIQKFMLEGFPGFASQLSNPSGPLVREYVPGSPTEGMVPHDLLPIMFEYNQLGKIAVESDPTGHVLVLKPAFAAVATAQDVAVEAAPLLDPFVPSQVVDHPQPVVNA